MEKKTRILIVEDNPLNREHLVDWQELFIEKENIDLQLSTDTQNSCLDEFRKKIDADVIILDFNLIGITGRQILEVLRTKGNPNRSIPVIFVPGNRKDLGKENERNQLLEEMNVIGIFQKPYVMYTIIGRVKDWLREQNRSNDS